MQNVFSSSRGIVCQLRQEKNQQGAADEIHRMLNVELLLDLADTWLHASHPIGALLGQMSPGS